MTTFCPSLWWTWWRHVMGAFPLPCMEAMPVPCRKQWKDSKTNLRTRTTFQSFYKSIASFRNSVTCYVSDCAWPFTWQRCYRLTFFQDYQIWSATHTIQRERESSLRMRCQPICQAEQLENLLGKGSPAGSLFRQEKHYPPHFFARVPLANFTASRVAHLIANWNFMASILLQIDHLLPKAGGTEPAFRPVFCDRGNCVFFWE